MGRRGGDGASNFLWPRHFLLRCRSLPFCGIVSFSFAASFPSLLRRRSLPFAGIIPVPLATLFPGAGVPFSLAVSLPFAALSPVATSFPGSLVPFPLATLFPGSIVPFDHVIAHMFFSK